MTAFETEAAPGAAPEPFGPGPTGALLPGRRGTVLIVGRGADEEQDLVEALGWVRALEADCGLVVDRERTELYAAASAAQLAARLAMPRAAGPAQDREVSEFVDLILTRGRWWHRGRTRPVPPDADDVCPWAWTYWQCLHEAPGTALCTLWDLTPLPAAADG